MRYFVIAPTGERYGPVDVATLNEWAASNRVSPTSKVMEEMSGTVLTASEVPGIRFAPMVPIAAGPIAPMLPPPPGMATIQPGFASALPQENGKREMWMAFGMAVAAPVVGLVMSYGMFLAIAGIAAAWRAMQRGQRWALLALILNIVALPAAFYMRFILRDGFLYGH